MAGLRLKAELGGDGSGFDAMMRRANAAKDKFGASFGGLKNVIAGAFTIGAISNLSKKTIDLAGHLRDVSDALSVNVEWFQKRANAAALAGASEDDLMKFMDNMNKSREEAFNNPGKETSQRFARLGFSEGDVSGLNTMDFFDKLVERFNAGADTQTTIDAEKVGGKAALKLMAAFKNGFDSAQPFMPEDIVNQLDAIGDRFTGVGIAMKVGLAPGLAAVAEAIGSLIGKTKEYVDFVGGYVEGQRQTTGWSEEYNKAGPLERFIREWSGSEYLKLLGRGHEKGMELGGQAALETEAENKTIADAIEEGIKKAADFRAAAAKAPPGFRKQDEEEKDQKKIKAGGGSLPTDSLVGVGNFLGRNPQLVNSVANQQLVVSRQQLDTLRIIANALKSNPMTRKFGDSINVP